MANGTLQFNPFLYTFPIEDRFNYVAYQEWVMQNWPMVFYFIGSYLIFVFCGQHYMKNKPRYELRQWLIIWNLLLAVFSTAGSLRTVPELLFTYRKGGFHDTVCVSNTSKEFNAPLFWTFLFICSKIPELVDTVFIVFRKQKLIILHWYHHAIVVFYAFFTYREHPAYIRWFVSMNFTIHGFMYSYYTLRALRVNIPKPVSMSVTVMQIAQMFVGSTVCCYAFVQKANGVYCNTTYESIILCFLMYLSFFVLFTNFFVRTYFVESKSQIKKVK